MNNQIENKLQLLPNKPGVYIMRDNLNNIIYVGKAKILKNRVRQYFRKNSNHNNKVLKMVENINDFNWIVTDSEIEALILECNLIKRHRPKYNILLKDDKTFPYIKLTLNEDYPRILFTRRIDDKTAKYYGPYTNSYSVKQTIDLLKKTFQIRDCGKKFNKMQGQRECLNYHIKQCSGPCMNYISKDDYKAKFNDIIDFLDGKSKKLISKLSNKMVQFSEKLLFEEAMDVKKQIEHLSHILEKQKISVPKDAEYDVVGIYEGERNICITIMFVRGGKLLGSKNMYFGNADSKHDVLSEFLKQFYDSYDRIPNEIILPMELSDIHLIKELIEHIKGKKVEFTVPLKGRKKELIEMAYNNANEGIKQKTTNKYSDTLKELQELLKIPNVPERMEVYDISNTSGSDIVGFMTVFIDGVPAKNEYRKFKIKYTEGQDDYECMYEVIYRRLLRYLDEKNKLESQEMEYDELKFINLPDIIFVDGGKGHVKAAKRAVNMAMLDIDIFGLVKDNKHKTRDITSEDKEFQCYKNRPVFNLVSKMQDETHNQAVKYHHSLRTKNTIQSELMQINGVGEKTRKKLLDNFKTIDAIKKASIEELTKSTNEKIAKNIFSFYHKKY